MIMIALYVCNSTQIRLSFGRAGVLIKTLHFRVYENMCISYGEDESEYYDFLLQSIL